MSKSKKIANKTQYVIPFGNAWVVKGEDNRKFTIITDKKREAVLFATEIAKRNEADMIVYGKKGEITASKSFRPRASARMAAKA